MSIRLGIGIPDRYRHSKHSTDRWHLCVYLHLCSCLQLTLLPCCYMCVSIFAVLCLHVCLSRFSVYLSLYLCLISSIHSFSPSSFPALRLQMWHILSHIHTHAHMCTHIDACMHAHMCTHVHIHACTHVHDVVIILKKL